MKQLSIKNTSVPALGFGTYKLMGDDCVDAIDFAISSGYTHIDTAQVYDNETAVGQGIKKSGVDRDKIFLTTKIWRNEFVGGTALKSVDDSLKKLQCDYVDLLLIHWPFPECNIEKMVEDIVTAQEQGKAKLIGVSNFTTLQMEVASKISGGKIACNQVEYHPYLSQKPILDAAAKLGMFTTAYSPIARGNVFKDAALKEIGLRHGKNAGQVTLRWFMQQHNVCAIPKSATKENIVGNMNIFDFELSEDEMKAVHGLAKPDGRMINPEFAPKWDKAA